MGQRAIPSRKWLGRQQGCGVRGGLWAARGAILLADPPCWPLVVWRRLGSSSRLPAWRPPCMGSLPQKSVTHFILLPPAPSGFSAVFVFSLAQARSLQRLSGGSERNTRWHTADWAIRRPAMTELCRVALAPWGDGCECGKNP